MRSVSIKVGLANTPGADILGPLYRATFLCVDFNNLDVRHGRNGVRGSLVNV